MPKVNSTAIKSIRRTGLNRFRIRFHGDRVYLVKAPGSVYNQLRNARSVGQTYNYKVKGNYPTRLVKG